jgi:hypothetical protein
MKNIFLEPGQTFRVVHPHEPLQEHFLVREMYERPMLSESGGWDTTFKGESWLGTAWHTVEDELPAWVGECIDKLNARPPYGTLKSDRFNYEVIEIIDL